MVDLSKEALELTYTKCQNLLGLWKAELKGYHRNSPTIIPPHRAGKADKLAQCITQLEEVLTGKSNKEE